MASSAKWERVEAAIAGRPVDRVPFAFWMHLPEIDRDPERLARATIDLHRRYDMDYVKVMFRSSWCTEDWGVTFRGYHPTRGYLLTERYAVREPGDWERLPVLFPDVGTFGEQLRVLRLVADELNGEAPILATLFAPSMIASQLAGEAVFVRHLREYPDAVHAGLRTITRTLLHFAQACLDQGADGLFYAIQQASRRVLTETEYRSIGPLYDFAVLNDVHGRSRLTMLHLHGDDLMFEELATYPSHVLNWYDRASGPTLTAARARTTRCLAGGIDHERTLVLGTPEEIAAEVRDAIAQMNGRGLLLAPGCGVPTIVSEASLRAAREAALDPVG